MKKLDKLNGLKSWWNRLCKPKYKVKMSADNFKALCISEYEHTGSVEMSGTYSKDGAPHQFH